MALKKYTGGEKGHRPDPSAAAPVEIITGKPQLMNNPVQVLPAMTNYFGYNDGEIMSPMMAPRWQKLFWQRSPFPATSTPAQREAGLSMLEAASVSQSAPQMLTQQMHHLKKQQQPQKNGGSMKAGSNRAQGKKKKKRDARHRIQFNVKVNRCRRPHAQQLKVNLHGHQSANQMSPDTKSDKTSAVKNMRQFQASNKASLMSKPKAHTPPGVGERAAINKYNYSRVLSEPVFPSSRPFSPTGMPQFPIDTYQRAPSELMSVVHHINKSMSCDQSSKSYQPYRKSISYDQGHIERACDNRIFPALPAFQKACDSREQGSGTINSAILRQDSVADSALSFSRGSDNDGMRARSHTDPTINRVHPGVCNTGFHPIHEHQHLSKMISVSNVGNDQSNMMRASKVAASDLFQGVGLSDPFQSTAQPGNMQQHQEPTYGLRLNDFLEGAGCTIDGTYNWAFVNIEDSGKAGGPHLADSSSLSKNTCHITREETPIKFISSSTHVLGINEEPQPQANDPIITFSDTYLRRTKQNGHSPSVLDRPGDEALHGGSLASESVHGNEFDLHSLPSIDSNGANQDGIIDFLEKDMADCDAK